MIQSFFVDIPQSSAWMTTPILALRVTVVKGFEQHLEKGESYSRRNTGGSSHWGELLAKLRATRSVSKAEVLNPGKQTLSCPGTIVTELWVTSMSSTSQAVYKCGAAMSGTVEWEREGPGPDSLRAAVVVRVFKTLLLYMLLCVCV